MKHVSLLLLCMAGCNASAAAAESPFVFRDIAASVGLTGPLRGAMAHAAAWGDINGDGVLDVFIGTYADRPTELYVAGGAEGPVPNRLLISRNGRLEPADPKAIAWLGRASGCVLADLDNDGRVDLYVANNGRLGKRNLLYQQRSDGSFADVTDRAGAPLDQPDTARSATVLDFDGDGRLDLLVLSGLRGGGTLLFRNLGGMRFELSDALPRDAEGLGVAVGDLTGNGWPDVMIGGPNRLFVNLGGGKFREAKELGLAAAFTREDDSPSCGVAFGDVDRDGDLDMLIGSHHKQPWAKPNAIRLLLNQGSTPERVRFEDVSQRVGIVEYPIKLPHVEIRDFDNDGWPDLYTAAVVSRDGSVYPGIFRNLGCSAGGLPKFQETAFVHRPDFPGPEDYVPGERSARFYERLVARGKAMYFAPGPSGDFDGDGRLDLLLASWFPQLPSMLLRNETPGGHFLGVELIGAGRVNPAGIGAIVRAYRAGEMGNARALLASEPIATAYGFCSAQPPVAHLGLGRATVCDLVVALPNGQGQIVRKNVSANQRLLLRVDSVVDSREK